MDGNLIVTGEEISKELNKYFLSVFNKEENRMPEPGQVFGGRKDEKLKDRVISKVIVSKEIDRLKKTKSPGQNEHG